MGTPDLIDAGQAKPARRKILLRRMLARRSRGARPLAGTAHASCVDVGRGGIPNLVSVVHDIPPIPCPKGPRPFGDP